MYKVQRVSGNVIAVCKNADRVDFFRLSLDGECAYMYTMYCVLIDSIKNQSTYVVWKASDTAIHVKMSRYCDGRELYKTIKQLKYELDEAIAKREGIKTLKPNVFCLPDGMPFGIEFREDKWIIDTDHGYTISGPSVEKILAEAIECDFCVTSEFYRHMRKRLVDKGWQVMGDENFLSPSGRYCIEINGLEEVFYSFVSEDGARHKILSVTDKSDYLHLNDEDYAVRVIELINYYIKWEVIKC